MTANFLSVPSNLQLALGPFVLTQLALGPFVLPVI